MPRKALKLLTLVTNSGGNGPGHSAMAVDDIVYSFENIGDWFSIQTENSGWKASAYDKYLEQNAFRPVIIQILNEKVNPYKVESFIKRSKGADDDYLTSGVCSSLCASAINAGVTFGFDCKGIDTPKKVYDLARKKGIVTQENVVWSGVGKTRALEWAGVVLKLEVDYPLVFGKMKQARAFDR
jgi:hypothetical protein